MIASIKDEISGPSVFPNETEACSLSSDCLEITCREDGDVNFDLSFQLILLPCFSPPAVRIVFAGVIKFDSIFHKTESATVDGTTSHVYVQLDYLNNGSIGFQARFSANGIDSNYMYFIEVSTNLYLYLPSFLPSQVGGTELSCY